MTATQHVLPMEKLSPADFERLCLWLVRHEGFAAVEHLGAAGGEQGRDLMARKDGRCYIFQCKREKEFGPADAARAVGEILALPETEHPDELVLVVSSNLSEAARSRARERCQGRFACSFWASTELDARIKAHPSIVREFFGPDALGTSVPFVLPQVSLPTFTGREQELAVLHDLLVDRRGLVSIAGLSGGGGIGKSALACHFAQRYQAAFPDGVIGLRVDGKEIDAVAREFIRCSRVMLDPEDDRPASALMQEVFGPRRALLIFDNAEDAEVAELLPGGNLCSVIVTTRDRGVPALLGVAEAARIDLPVLPTPESIALLALLLGPQRVAAEPDAVLRIVGLVGNLPLALQIVAAMLREQQWRRLADFTASLEEERLRLAKLRVRGDSHLDVRASFSLSLRMLSEPEEVDFLACLSVCARDGFSLRAASAAGGCDEEVAHERLGILCRYSLLNPVEADSCRFTFHPLLHLFASELAEDRGLRADAAERHARFYEALVSSGRPRDPVSEAEMAGELGDALLAAEWFVAQGLPEYRFADHLGSFCERLGRWREAAVLNASFGELAERSEHWNAALHCSVQRSKFLALLGQYREAERVLAATDMLLSRIEPPSARLRGEALVLHSLGITHQRQGRYDDALDAFQRRLNIAVELGDRQGEQMVLNSLAGALQRMGRLDEAITALDSSLAIAVELGNRVGEQMVLNSLGGVLQRQGRFDEAITAFERSLAIAVELGNRVSEQMVLNSLGGVLQRQGRFDEAIDAFERSLTITVELGTRISEHMVLNSLGGVLQRQGRFDKAIDAFERSLAIVVELRNRVGEAQVLNSLGSVLQRQGRLDRAIDALERSLAIEEEVGNRHGEAMALNSLGGILHRKGSFGLALEAFRRSYALLLELQEERGQMMALNSLGGTLQRMGLFAEAIDAFQRSHRLAVRLADPRGRTMILNSLGGAFSRQGRFDQAAAAFRRSYGFSVELGDRQGQAKILTSLGAVLQRMKRFDEAVEVLQRGQEIEEELGNRRGWAMVLNSLGSAQQRLGLLDQAADSFQRSLAIEEELGNRRGQTMVLNNLGLVFKQQGLLAKALESFERSRRIAEEMGDSRGLSIIHTSTGKALLQHGDLERAAQEFGKSFEIDLRLRHRRGLEIVTLALGETLSQLGRTGEALERCRTALAVASGSRKLLDLEARLSRLVAAGSDLGLRRGSIKKILRHAQGYAYGFIAPDDGGPDVYFREGVGIAPAGLAQLVVGAHVEFEAEQGHLGPRAIRVRVP